MPDWGLIVVAALTGVGAAVLIGYAMGEAARDRRMRSELLHGWWCPGDGGDQDR